MIDTTIVTTTAHSITQTTLVKSIQADLDPTHWFLLFSGLLFYWSKTLNATRIVAAGKPYLRDFWRDNWIEMPTSVFACVILAVMAKSVSVDMLDLHGVVSVFMTGYFSSSILNALITQGKPSFKNIPGAAKSGVISLLALLRIL
jgi:hypothetical protein